MNVSNQTLLHIKAGQIPPDALLTAILGKKPTAFGFAVQNLHEGKPDLAITRENGDNLNLDGLKGFFENSKAFSRTLYFGTLPTGYNPEDIQPFVIHDGDNNPFMALFLEGMIVGHDDPKDRTEQFNLTNSILIPKILEWCNDFDGDLEKILTKMRGEVFKKDFMTHIGHRAVLHVLPVDGDPVNLGENKIGSGDTDWGWTSQTHDFDKVEEKPEPVAAAAPKARFGWGGAKAAASVPAVAIKDAATPGTHDRAADKSNSIGSRPAQGSTGGAAVLAARPPTWVHKNEDVKLWYKVVHGESIAAWKKRIPVTVKDFEAAKIDNLVAFKEYALKKQLRTTPGSADTETSAGPVPATTAAADVKALAENGDLPIIEPKRLEDILSFVASLDTSSKEIVAPTAIQSMEEALPKFSAQVGLDPMETINWPANWLVNIGKKDIMALVCYAIEWRSAYRALKTGQPQAETKTTTKQVGATTIVQSSSKEATPAKTKSRFGFGSKAA